MKITIKADKHPTSANRFLVGFNYAGIRLNGTKFRLLLSLAMVFEYDKKAWLNAEFLSQKNTPKYLYQLKKLIKSKLGYTLLILNDKNGNYRLDIEEVEIEQDIYKTFKDHNITIVKQFLVDRNVS